MSNEIAVFGAGGHAKVLVSTLKILGYYPIRVFDGDPQKVGNDILGLAVEAWPENPDTFVGAGVIGIGNNVVRGQIARSLIQVEWRSPVHPGAIIDESVKLGKGTVVFAGAVIQPDTIVGVHSIINTGATVDHDCVLGDYVHIAPGAHLAGGVFVGDRTLMGAGSVTRQNIRIGEGVVVGVGAAVVRAIPRNVTVVGVPAKPIRLL